MTDGELENIDVAVESMDASASALAALEPIGRCGRYELLGQIAVGGMAEIFLGRERVNNTTRYVVIKRILQAASGPG